MAQQQRNVEELNYSHKVYDFMRWSHIAFSLSAILIIISIVVIVVNGFNWGLDFTGGLMIELNLKNPMNIDKIREMLEQADFTNPLVQNFGSLCDIMIRIPPMKNKLDQELGNKIITLINQGTDQGVVVKRFELVGPSVGSNLMQDGGTAILAALICILIYISFRFEWRLATGVVLALVHDIVITLGILSLFYIEIDLTTIASLMSVIGYSLNDSIVVSDRIRENFRKIYHANTYDIFNISLTQILGRTIITSTVTLAMVLILLIFGGSMLHGFSITLLIGIFIGTLSSIYVASSFGLKFGIKRENIL